MREDVVTATALWRFWMLDAWLDMTLRHRASLLGLFWQMFPTLFFVVLVGSIFRHVMSAGVSFYLYLLIGLVVWAPINQVLTGSADCYRANRAFLMVGGLNPITFNFKLIFHSFLFLIIQGVLVVAGVAAFRSHVTHEVVYSFLGLALLFVLLLPVSIILALIGARFQDFSEAFRSFVRVLFLSTPIIWTLDNQNRFEAVRMFLYVNPFFFALEIIRAPLLGEPVNHAYWLPLAAYAAGAWIVAVILYVKLRRTTTLWL